MGVTLELQTILVVLGIALFLTYFVLYKIDKKFAGLSIILIAFTMFALPSKVPNIAEYIFGSILIIGAIGFYTLLYGLFNRKWSEINGWRNRNTRNNGFSVHYKHRTNPIRSSSNHNNTNNTTFYSKNG